MTFSIVAADPEANEVGVAVESKFLACAALVSWARGGVGAVATQAFVEVTYGRRGLDLLEEGLDPEQVLARLTEPDPLRAQRQVGVVAADGRSASYTGGECIEHAASVTGPNFACQGNILASDRVVPAMAEAFETTKGLPLAERMIETLRAGQREGGDKRGQEGAGLYVAKPSGGYGGNHDRYIDLRVDDHEEPVTELIRIFDLYDRTYLIRHDTLLALSPELLEEIQRRLVATGDLQGEPTGRLDHATQDALASFAGQYNLESKATIGENGVYESVVRELRDITPGVGAGS